MAITTFLSFACAVALLIPSNVDASLNFQSSMIQGKLRGGVDHRHLQASSWCLTDPSQEACQPLMAGQFEQIGTVCVKEHPTMSGKVQVTYSLQESSPCGSWQFDEIHLYVGESEAGIPQTRKGNPMIGKFPFTSENPGTTTETIDVGVDFSCPSNDGNKVFFVAAHAAVKCYNHDGQDLVETDSQTAWTGGDSTPMVDKGSWATWFNFELTCNCVEQEVPEEPEEPVCETAFAKYSTDSTCFLDIDENDDGIADFNRWGWTQPLPFEELVSYTLKIYAGAGQCDVNKGTHVGNLEVVYNSTNIMKTTWDVTWSTFGPYTTTEVHLYVGDEILARDTNANDEYTVAPGQYEWVEEFGEQKTSHTISILADQVSPGDYIVAHSVTCGF